MYCILWIAYSDFGRCTWPVDTRGRTVRLQDCLRVLSSIPLVAHCYQDQTLLKVLSSQHNCQRSTALGGRLGSSHGVAFIIYSGHTVLEAHEVKSNNMSRIIAQARGCDAMPDTVSDKFKLRLNYLGREGPTAAKGELAPGVPFSENASFAELGHRATINARAIPEAVQSSAFTLSQEPANMASNLSIVASPLYRLRRAASCFLNPAKIHRPPAPRPLTSTQDQTSG